MRFITLLDLATHSKRYGNKNEEGERKVSVQKTAFLLHPGTHLQFLKELLCWVSQANTFPELMYLSLPFRHGWLLGTKAPVLCATGAEARLQGVRPSAMPSLRGFGLFLILRSALELPAGPGW